MKKFSMSREKVMQMSGSMEQNFKRVGLPFAMTDESLVASSIDAHRILSWCEELGAAAQDAAMEVIFHGYFAEGRAPNEPALLVAAAVAAGRTEADARRFLDDKNARQEEVNRELTRARKLDIRGVPHFVISREGGRSVQISGAQPPEEFVRALSSI